MKEEKEVQENTSDFMEQVVSSLDNLNMAEEGQIVEGVVVQVTDDYVFLDIGCKCEGRLPIDEFMEAPEYGDKVNVYLKKTFGKDGSPVISKRKADEDHLIRNINVCLKKKLPISGKITAVVKGGYDVMLTKELRAFLPISQADIQHVENPESLVGLSGKFLIERSYTSDGKQNVVVNRRKYLEQEIERKRNEFFNTAKVGDVYQGVIKSFTSFGAFVDLGGFDGLLHINDMSWGHITRPKDVVKKGQKVDVKLIRLDPDTKRINVSLKHMTDDPWIHFEDKFHVNDVVEGTVTKFTDFGAFVELTEGIEGLVHLSELSWTKKINKPEEVLKVGEKVKCMILGYDIQGGRVSLGIKQVTPNPWESIGTDYPVGKKVKGKIAKITNTAAFITLESGVDAYLAADDISWTKKVKHPSSVLKQGDEVEVCVLESSSNEHKIKVGMKQVTENPWIEFAKKYDVGSVLEGTVASITSEYGVFVRTEEGIEGLINKANLSEDEKVPYEEAVKKYNTGDKITVYITDINPEREKVGFSVRELKKMQERKEISQYMASEAAEDEGAYTVGDFVKNQKNDKGKKK